MSPHARARGSAYARANARVVAIGRGCPRSSVYAGAGAAAKGAGLARVGSRVHPRGGGLEPGGLAARCQIIVRYGPRPAWDPREDVPRVSARTAVDEEKI